MDVQVTLMGVLPHKDQEALLHIEHNDSFDTADGQYVHLRINNGQRVEVNVKELREALTKLCGEEE